jgi:hypothetical protein
MLRMHVFHHADASPKIAAKAARNTKCWTVEATVSNCSDPDKALELLQRVTDSLCRTYSINQSMQSDKEKR